MKYGFSQTGLEFNFGVAFAAFGILFSSISPACADETPPLAFVSEFIRELSAYERIRDQGAADAQANGAGNMADCIRNTTAFQLELNSQIAILRTMKLNAPFDDIIKDLILFDEMKNKSWAQFNYVCTTMQKWRLSGPKAGVDYVKIIAAMPKITAQLEYIDRAIFEASPMVFSTLIDETPDKQNHLSHLIITKAERQKLIDDIDM